MTDTEIAGDCLMYLRHLDALFMTSYYESFIEIVSKVTENLASQYKKYCGLTNKNDVVRGEGGAAGIYKILCRIE